MLEIRQRRQNTSAHLAEMLRQRREEAAWLRSLDLRWAALEAMAQRQGQAGAAATARELSRAVLRILSGPPGVSDEGGPAERQAVGLARDSPARDAALLKAAVDEVIAPTRQRLHARLERVGEEIEALEAMKARTQDPRQARRARNSAGGPHFSKTVAGPPRIPGAPPVAPAPTAGALRLPVAPRPPGPLVEKGARGFGIFRDVTTELVRLLADVGRIDANSAAALLGGYAPFSALKESEVREAVLDYFAFIEGRWRALGKRLSVEGSGDGAALVKS